MNKRLIIGTVLLALVIVIIVSYDSYLHKQEDLRLPSRLGSYSETGYFKIDPATILGSLDSGDTDVFIPLLEDPDLIAPLSDVSISWTQSDFMDIARALGQLVWNDPMHLMDWNIYYLFFERTCEDNPVGLSFATITYYKEIEVNGRRMYTTRLIEIHPIYAWVRWGSGATYPQPFLRRWNSVDLSEAKITADNALRIAEDNGGKEVRLQAENKCAILISSPQNDDNQNWYLSYIVAPNPVDYVIDLATGNHEILSTDR
jgi:hypothetical protein